MKIGFLGGGQLARMMVLKAHELGLDPWVLTQNADDPAAQVASHTALGTIETTKKETPPEVTKFFSECDIVTFESEFIECKKVELLAKQHRCKVFPNTKAMATLQDRLTQKQLLSSLRLASSDFIHPADEGHLKKFFNAEGALVLKKRLFGYDGYGTFVLKTKAQLNLFLKQHKDDLDLFVAEKWVKFQRELAITFVRGQEGQTVSLPMVETKQQENRCFWVKGPVSHNMQSKLSARIRRALNKIDYIGAITFELFDIGNELLINEVAPRVHNSAHYSQQGLIEDQFLLHIKAGLGMQLRPPELVRPGFAMVNLIGTHYGPKKIRKLSSSVSLHWYGKKEARPGRKMGHLNSVSSSSSQALRNALKALQEISS